MAGLQTNDALVSVLQMLKQQLLFSNRLHGWVIAVAETIEKQPELAIELRQHPTYDQGFAPSLRNIDVTIRNIDALIQQLTRSS